jgi:O-antigen/teichoic acid export membrane protein
VDKGNQADIKTIARNAGISGLGDIFSAVIIFVTNVLMTRTVGASIYGTFILAKNTTIVGGVLGSFGIHQGLLHFLPFYKGKRNWSRVKGTLLSGTQLTALFSFATAVFLFLGADQIAGRVFHTPSMAPALKVLAFSIPWLAFAKLWLNGVRAMRAVKYWVLVGKVIRPAMCLALLSLLFLVGLKLYSLVFSELISIFLAAGLSLYFLRRLLPPQWHKIQAVPDRRELLGFSAPLFLVDTLNFILRRVDIIIIGIFLISQQVGIYNAAVRVAMLLAIPLASVNSIFAPMIAEYHGRGDMINLHRNFKVATRWIFSSVFPLCLFILLFPIPLLRLFGAEFAEGSKALVILSCGQLVNATAGPVAYMIMMTGHPKLNLVNTLSLALVNIVLNLLLIPKFGIIGAAIAAATSAAAINILRIIEVHHILRVHPYQWNFLKPLASGLSAGILTYFLFLRNATILSPLILSLGMLTHFAIYIAMMALLRFPEEDKVVLKALSARLRRKGDDERGNEV